MTKQAYLLIGCLGIYDIIFFHMNGLIWYIPPLYTSSVRLLAALHDYKSYDDNISIWLDHRHEVGNTYKSLNLICWAILNYPIKREDISGVLDQILLNIKLPRYGLLFIDQYTVLLVISYTQDLYVNGWYSIYTNRLVALRIP